MLKYSVQLFFFIVLLSSTPSLHAQKNSNDFENTCLNDQYFSNEKNAAKYLKTVYGSNFLVLFPSHIALNLGDLIKEADQLLRRSYKEQMNDKLASLHFQKFNQLIESLFKLSHSNVLKRQELELNFAKNETIQQKELRKTEEKSSSKAHPKWNIILSVSFVLVILSLLFGFSIYQYKMKNKSKLELQCTIDELNHKNSELEEKNSIIKTQNEEITDSIHYARQIQQAILPSQQDLNAYFSDAFVLFAPKDLISGDFYWATSLNGKTILATVDCTGHGIPGGFMSMLGISLLNELVNEQGHESPALILTKLREKVISSLRQKGAEGEQKNGMDMTICIFDQTKNSMTYATANQVFYLIRNQNAVTSITEFKGDRHPVGIFGEEQLAFHEYVVPIQKGDRIYTFTDGYPDQFGGPKGKKFKYQQLKETILSAQNKSMLAQHDLLLSNFNNWKSDLEQTDDVTVIGIQV